MQQEPDPKEAPIKEPADMPDPQPKAPEPKDGEDSEDVQQDHA